MVAAQALLPDRGAVTATVHPAVNISVNWFNEEGSRQGPSATPAGTSSAYSTGVSVSAGLSALLAARLAWQPGFTFASRYAGDADRRRNGASNLRLEIPLRLLAAPGVAPASDPPSPHSVPPGLLGRAPIDLTVAPVGIIKIRGYNLEAQADRRQAGETYIAEHPDIKANALGFALGERVPLGPRAALSSEQEILFYFPADYAEQSLANYDQNLVRDGIDGADGYDTIYYRYRLSGAVGGSYLLQDFPKNRWTAGLSLGGHYMPAPIVDDILVENTDSFLVSIEPSIAVAPRAWNGRTSFELSWSIPLFGKNKDATHEIALAFRTTLYSPDGDESQADDADAEE
jgi:hypothetical protein